MVKGSDLGGADPYQLLKTTRPKDSQHQQWGAELRFICLEALSHQYTTFLAFYRLKIRRLLKLTFFVSILN